MAEPSHRLRDAPTPARPRRDARPRALPGAAALAVLGTIALVVSRRPDGLLNPQFWAEDGALWYAQAYNEGALRALGLPAAGYLQSFSRLTAALSLAVDLRWAPLVFEIAAVLVQVLPPLYVLSSRYAHVMPDVRVRLLAALLLVGAPNGFEIQSNVTNAQTHFAILSLLVVLAAPPRGIAAAALDVLLLLVGGLSGPTCALLLPVAALAWWIRPSRRRAGVTLVVLLPATVQTVTYLWSGGAGRMATPLGARLALLLQILGGQIFFAGTLGARAYGLLLRHRVPWWPGASALVGFAGLVVVARALVVAESVELGLVVLFAALVLAAALSSPAIDASPRWPALLAAYAGGRYYAPAIVAWLAVLLWGACADPSVPLRRLARALLLAVLLIGVPLDWYVRARPDLGFARHAARFAEAPPGAVVQIPIPPAGWRMELHKH